MAVCGRVAPEIVYDYIREVLICPNNEICVVMLDWNIDEKRSYDTFFNYFYIVTYIYLVYLLLQIISLKLATF